MRYKEMFESPYVARDDGDCGVKVILLGITVDPLFPLGGIHITPAGLKEDTGSITHIKWDKEGKVFKSRKDAFYDIDVDKLLKNCKYTLRAHDCAMIKQHLEM